jgi:hypothetical protein
MSAIFGGSKQKSQQQSSSQQYSGNQAYPYVQQAADPWVQIGNKSGGMLANLLGLGDNAAGDAAFNQYKDSTGFRSTLDTGMDAINTNQAVAGQLGSGKTLKALTQFGQDANQKYLGNYLTQLLGLSGQGSDALKTIAGAGQYSQGTSQSTGTSSGSSNNGMGSFLGSLLAAVPSDPRLKTDVRYVGTREGLNVYDYRYIWEPEGYLRRGYMADEVAEFRPDALGPPLGEFLTLDYTKLPSLED